MSRVLQGCYIPHPSIDDLIAVLTDARERIGGDAKVGIFGKYPVSETRLRVSLQSAGDEPQDRYVSFIGCGDKRKVFHRLPHYRWLPGSFFQRQKNNDETMPEEPDDRRTRHRPDAGQGAVQD